MTDSATNPRSVMPRTVQEEDLPASVLLDIWNRGLDRIARSHGSITDYCVDVWLMSATQAELVEDFFNQ